MHVKYSKMPDGAISFNCCVIVATRFCLVSGSSEDYSSALIFMTMAIIVPFRICFPSSVIMESLFWFKSLLESPKFSSTVGHVINTAFSSI